LYFSSYLVWWLTSTPALKGLALIIVRFYQKETAGYLTVI